MIDARLVRSVSAILLAAAAVLACSREETFDYCRHHYQVHADHQDSVARLDGSLSAEGLLLMRLQLPASVLDSGPAADRAAVLQSLLQSPDQVFRLETNQDCSTAKVQVISVASGQDSVIDGGIELEYRYECGVGNRVRVVNIELFGLLQGLEEVVVQMDTMAAGKRFAINRLCDKPIFRLQ